MLTSLSKGVIEDDELNTRTVEKQQKPITELVDIGLARVSLRGGASPCAPFNSLNEVASAGLSFDVGNSP